MERDLNTMTIIQEQKERDLQGQPLQPLNPEGCTLAEHKRFTFDIVDVPTDPLR